jgi:hypothetical protein
MIMVRKSLIAVALAVVVSGAAVGLSMNGTVAQAAGTTTQPVNPGGERHPEIHIAIRHLEEAKRNLEKATHDYGGHRAAALKATEDALSECRQALESTQAQN